MSRPADGSGAPRHHVGVDGGGTSVRAVVVDDDGRVLGRATEPGERLSATDLVTATRAVEEAVRAAARTAGAALPVASLWAGLAGAGREEVRSRVEAELSTRGLAAAVAVGTDADAAFESAFRGGPGILLIAGTGSVALGRNGAGRRMQVGGWGPRLGDEGGGYWLAMQALGAVARAEDGRGQETLLRERILVGLEQSDARDLIPWADGATRREIAALAPLVLEAAEDGDPVAAALVTDGAAALRSHVVALLDRLFALDTEPPALALRGGLLEREGPMRRTVDRVLLPLRLERAPEEVDAALGAARLARTLVAEVG